MKKPTGKPCRECPFRRESAPGYVGNDNPLHFAMTVQGDAAMPCHMTVDYEAKDWKKEIDPETGSATYCSGALIFFANQCKQNRDRSRPALPPDRTKVFHHVGEFLAHHLMISVPEAFKKFQEATLAEMNRVFGRRKTR